MNFITTTYPKSNENNLRIGTYNIGKNINDTRIGEIINAANFDIIALQEAGDLPIDKNTYLTNLGLD